ncbi:uncharacterized protein BDV17DRAFT_288725 [Aspergillus undulatus]|uniref:uncharacterized protein n=1 Tax=Aspergillus undulatus TaxID=1810928 RepID=UPI003CCDA32F
MTAAHSFDAPKAYDGRNAIPISTSSYPFTQEYPTAHSLGSEATYAHSPTYPTQSNPEDLSSLNNLCWTAEFDHLGGPGLLSPDWELDADESIQPLASTTTPIHPDAHSKQYPLLTEPFPSHQYMIYLQLLHGIEQTVQFAHQCKSPGHGSTALSALDSTLVSSQRYTTTLLQLTSNPSFAHTYNEDHLLLSVVLDKLICLYSLAYSDLKRSMEIYDGMSMGITCPGAGSLDRWTRFGAFEMNVAEQMVLCRRTFAEELERARACLGRLMDAMGLGLSTPVSVSSSHGRHESMCEELKRKLDALMDDLERDQGNDGVHLVC